MCSRNKVTLTVIRRYKINSVEVCNLKSHYHNDEFINGYMSLNV